MTSSTTYFVSTYYTDGFLYEHKNMYFFGVKSLFDRIANKNKILDEELTYDIIPLRIPSIIKISTNIKHKHRWNISSTFNNFVMV